MDPVSAYAVLLRVDGRGSRGHYGAMSKLETIEGEIRALSREDAERLQDWLADFLEEDQEVGPGFAASIERGKADLAAGRSRLREDQPGEQGE